MVKPLILNKCLDDDFVELLEPGGKLGFVIPSIRDQWVRHFPQGLYFELCEGNVFRVSDLRRCLLALQYRAGQIGVVSQPLRILPSLGWIDLGNEGVIGRFRELWESSLRHSSRIKKLLRNQGRFIRIATAENECLVARMEVLSWEPSSSFLPVDFDRDRQIVTGFEGDRILVLLRHYNGWHDIERRMVEALTLQPASTTCITTIAADVKRLALQQIRLGLIPSAAASLIPKVVQQIQFGIIAYNVNPRSGRWKELKDRMERYPEIRMPVYGWKRKWSPPFRLLIPGVLERHDG